MAVIFFINNQKREFKNMSENIQPVISPNPIINNPWPEILEEETWEPNRNPGTEWFTNAGFGLFIHWGLSSVRGNLDLSWGMIEGTEHNKGFFKTQNVPPAVYWKQAEKFDAENYDPGKWLAAAANAGIQYAVLTTRHHDGFALWPTEYSDFSTKKHLGGRDLVREYVDACRANGLKVGFYYSPPDWYLERKWMNYKASVTEFLDENWNSVEKRIIPKEEKLKIREYNRLQVEELLTRYGTVDLLWFDCVYGADAIPLSRIRELQPGIVVNNRGRKRGDFLSKDEERFPETRYPDDLLWDCCDTFLMPSCWGYTQCEAYRPAGWALETLARVRSWNGKFLLNCAPNRHGEMPECYYSRMTELAEWMKENRETVFDLEPNRYWPEQCNVPVTRRGDTLYLHIPYGCAEKVVFRNCLKPRKLTWMDGSAVPHEYRDGTLTIPLPNEKLTGMSVIVKLCK